MNLLEWNAEVSSVILLFDGSILTFVSHIAEDKVDFQGRELELMNEEISSTRFFQMSKAFGWPILV